MIFEGKVALVTGAGGGIGAAISRMLVERGARVAVVDIDLGRAQETVDAIEGGRAIAIETDLKVPEQIAAAVDRTVAEFGKLDVLINNATDGSDGSWLADQDFMTLTPEVWDSQHQVNSRAVFLTIQKAIPEFRKAGGGAIVNVASLAGMKGMMSLTAYGASKGAMIALSRHVATQYGKENIRCNLVAPGLTIHPRLLAKMPTATQIPKDAILLNEFAQAEDIAEAVCFLASDAARCITGQLLPVDSGSTAGTWTPTRRTS